MPNIITYVLMEIADEELMYGGWGFFESKKKKKHDEQIKNFDKKFNGTPP
jgi:hypothetical protein